MHSSKSEKLPFFSIHHDKLVTKGTEKRNRIDKRNYVKIIVKYLNKVSSF